MPKTKSSRAARKRFKVTGTGKVARRKANKSHILTKKTQKRKRRLRKQGLVDESQKRTIRRLIQQ